ncbi:MAG: heavy-metal-associated domain-containing protein [Candidatus Eisenbacteria sp.]|nr:heavy-metal-associated domain-containing protein [Candidatus Eisenbacteria bacterium]
MPTIHIVGMTCQHCVMLVEEALGRVDGVTDVEVDLDSGTATFSEEKPVDMAAIRQAVVDAGYEVA